MTGPEGFGTDTDYLRDKQYRDPTNLNARIALHARFARADEPWYPWLAGRVDWPEDGEVLEVGCGPGLLWTSIAPLLPRFRLTLTDLSAGMLDAARAVVDPIDSIDLVATRAADAQDLPLPDASFDIVVANPHAVPRTQSTPGCLRVRPGTPTRRRPSRRDERPEPSRRHC